MIRFVLTFLISGAVAIANPLVFLSGSSRIAITYFSSAANPVDGVAATNATATITITPPGSMLTGDLVFVACASRATATWTVGVNGGQTWTTESPDSGGQVFWATFNGTWGANPRFDSTSSTNTSVIMHVFRPSSTSKVWAIDVAKSSTSFSAPSGPPFNVTQTGLTTAHNDTVALAIWSTLDDNTWGNLSGSGWVVTGDPQYRNVAGSDQSLAFAHHIDSTSGTIVPSAILEQTSLGADAGLSFIMSFYAN